MESLKFNEQGLLPAIIQDSETGSPDVGLHG